MTAQVASTRTPIDYSRIWQPALLHQVLKNVFPWPADQDLDGNDVGYVFFLDPNASQLWDNHLLKTTLKYFGDIGIDCVDREEFLTATVPPDLSEWELLMGAVLFLDQATRYLCKGVDARYIYHFFDTLSKHLVHHLIETRPQWFTLRGWEVTGLSHEQIVLRLLMLLAPLVHSEELTDQHKHIALTEQLRAEFEDSTQTRDPYRSSFAEDSKDIWLINALLTSGPPQGPDVRLVDFVYWMMRYYTSHIPYVSFFGRSPFRNVAVGRDDSPEESIWLRKNGVCWDAAGEAVRQKIKADIAAGVWTPLQLQTREGEALA